MPLIRRKSFFFLVGLLFFFFLVFRGFQIMFFYFFLKKRGREWTWNCSWSLCQLLEKLVWTLKGSSGIKEECVWQNKGERHFHNSWGFSWEDRKEGEMLMNYIYIAVRVCLAQQPSVLPGGNLRYRCTKMHGPFTPLHFLWVGLPLLRKAVACDNEEEILVISPKGFPSFQIPFCL